MTTDDIAALPLVKIGSGANMPGYYMYHGGRDLIGKLSTLQESQATNYPNDMPEINYDFQAPLGQFSQIRDSYHALRLLHTFLADFGSTLAPMQSFLPAITPTSLNDTQTLRWAVRSNGHSGFIFINNYQRGSTLPDHPNTQFNLKLTDGPQLVPAVPINIPSNAYMIWPFNLDMNGTLLKSTTTQLLCRLDGDIPTYVFFSTPGIKPRFDFATGPIIPTDMDFIVTSPDGRQTKIILLSRNEALQSWKANFRGADRLFISSANLIFDGPTLRLQGNGLRNLNVMIFSPPNAPPVQKPTPSDRWFSVFSVEYPSKSVPITFPTNHPDLPYPVPSTSAKEENPTPPPTQTSPPPQPGTSPFPPTHSMASKT